MLLELKNIKKYFGAKKGLLSESKDFVKAVDGIDLSVSQSENIGLVGESGCGKTTLARIILKLIPPDAGQIIFDQKNISRLSISQMRPLRQTLQMVFQDPYDSLDPRFTVRHIIREAMIFDKTKKRVEKDQKTQEMLAAVGLPTDILNRFPHEFSGGERQRIAIARALVMNPKLLILDEAVSALDVLVQKQITNLLADLQERFNLTYLFISHNLRVVKKISAKIAVMYKGKIVEFAETKEIFNNPLHPYTKKLLSAPIDYKVEKSAQDILVKSESQLIDRGNGHFVIE